MKKFFLLLAALAISSCTANIYKSNLDFARALANQGLWREAAFRLEKELQKKPTAEIYNNLAVCYEALNQLQRAEEYYQLALQLEPANQYIKENYKRFKAKRIPDEQK